MTDRIVLPTWVARRVGEREPGPGITRVLETLVTNLREASYASTSQLARLAGVNVATVVRAAQFLGFSGWPGLRAEARAHYLEGLSAAQTLDDRKLRGDTSDVAAVVRRGIENLHELAGVLDPDAVRRAATHLVGGGVSVILGSGSFAAPGVVLSHLLQSLGHDVRLVVAGETAVLNAVTLLGPGDNLVVIDAWRTTRLHAAAMRQAHAAGATVIRFTDVAEVGSTRYIPLQIVSEGVSMFQSFAPAVSAVEAVLAAVVDLDEQAAQRYYDEQEARWEEARVFGERTLDLQ